MAESILSELDSDQESFQDEDVLMNTLFEEELIASSAFTSGLDSRPSVNLSKNVIVRYGPYHYEGVYDYRTCRLQGLLRSLEKVGAIPHLERAPHADLVRVWHQRVLIFQCKITDLQHGMDGSMDHFCKEAVRAFSKAIKKITRATEKRFKLKLDSADQNDPRIPPVLVCGTEDLPLKKLKYALVPWD